MTLSDHRAAPQDSSEPDVDDLELPAQSRHESIDPDDDHHVIRGYD